MEEQVLLILVFLRLFLIIQIRELLETLFYDLPLFFFNHLL